MWPHEPDELESAHVAPDDADHGDAWYFVFTDAGLVTKNVQGTPCRRNSSTKAGRPLVKPGSTACGERSMPR